KLPTRNYFQHENFRASPQEIVVKNILFVTSQNKSLSSLETRTTSRALFKLKFRLQKRGNMSFYMVEIVPYASLNYLQIMT
ncbi:MAG: hypothetical protein Q4D14_02710, partial [Bacteroidales bacterium]|nr:hypothetical protein [Bacteroidales bacterium]